MKRHSPATLGPVSMALGDALMAPPLGPAPGLPRTAVRNRAEQMLVDAAQRAKLAPPETAKL